MATKKAKVRDIRVLSSGALELRHNLGMTREVFRRLVNVSVRAIAKAEKKEHVEKLVRPYREVNKLCKALFEVVEPEVLGDWFMEPNDAFEGLTPLEVVERGDIDRLWEMCFRLRSGIPS